MIAAAVRQLLKQGGFGALETDLFEDRLPTKPLSAISVFSYDSGFPILGLCPERQQDTAPFHIEVRRATQAAARDTAYAVYDYLDGQVGVTPSGFARIEEMSARYPFYLRRDAGEPQGVIFVVNGEAVVDVP